MSAALAFMAELYAEHRRKKATAPLREAALDLYRALVSEHGHDESTPAPWPSCLPVHIAMRRYRKAADAALATELGHK